MLALFRRFPWQAQIGMIVAIVAVLAVAGLLALRQYQAGSPDSLPEVETVDVGGVAAILPQGERPFGIHVVGEGEVVVSPDQAIVVLGVEASADTAAEAAAQTSAVAETVIAAVRALGIEASDIQTTGLSLSPVYPPESQEAAERQAAPIGYISTNTLTITVHKIALASEVLDAALDAGANSVHAVQFTLADDTKAKEAALRLATLDAARKARTIAESLQGSMRGLISISEDFVTVSQPRGFADIEMARAAGEVSVPVEPGELRVRAVVRANFAYE